MEADRFMGRIGKAALLTARDLTFTFGEHWRGGASLGFMSQLLSLHALLLALALGADPGNRVDRNYVPPAPPPVVIKTYKTYEAPGRAGAGSGSGTWGPRTNSTSRGEASHDSDHEERSPDLSLESEEKCRRGDGAACLHAGLSIGGSDSPRRARPLFARSCTLGCYRGCLALGHSHLDPRYGPADLSRAAGAFRRACDGGEGAGCLSLSECYRSGACGFAADQTEAARLLKAGCCLGHKRSCEADGSPSKPTLKQQACEAAGTPSRAAIPEAVKQKVAECAAGNLNACEMGGYLLATVAAPWRNPKEAVPLLTKACDGNSISSCAHLASVYYAGGAGLPADHPAALRLAERSCDRSNKLGCTVLARLLLRGKGVRQDAKRAQAVLAKAEATGDGAALEVLGDLYAEGLGGVPVDRARARSYYHRACAAGNEAACPKR